MGNNILDTPKTREYDINDYDTESDLGVFLSQTAFFYGTNHLIGSMKKISGFLDSSGKVETLSDEIVVVAASLATPFYWQEFAKEWKSYLVANGCRDKNQRVLFHATQFHNRSYPYRETWGWDEEKRRVFYDGLIDLIDIFPK